MVKAKVYSTIFMIILYFSILCMASVSLTPTVGTYSLLEQICHFTRASTTATASWLFNFHRCVLNCMLYQAVAFAWEHGFCHTHHTLNRQPKVWKYKNYTHIPEKKTTARRKKYESSLHEIDIEHRPEYVLAAFSIYSLKMHSKCGRFSSEARQPIK